MPLDLSPGRLGAAEPRSIEDMRAPNGAFRHVPGAEAAPVSFAPRLTVDGIAPLTRLAVECMAASCLQKGRSA